jgi:hypothetical protein
MNELPTAIKRALAQPAFVAALVILGTAAVGLNASVHFLQLHFKKQPVDLRRPLEMIPERLGKWINMSAKETLNPEMEDVLGTKQYIFRNYIDSTQLSQAELAKFTDLPIEDREAMAAQIQHSKPSAVVRAAVTYYTGLVDTVAHIPDRCYVADGYEPTTYTTPQWSAFADRPGDKRIRYINFEDQTPSRKSVNRNVAYVFNCNGRYESDPLGVRQSLQNLRERYGYYAKIELMTTMDDRETSARIMNEFLDAALPEIEKSLPDWEAIKAGKTPAVRGDHS